MASAMIACSRWWPLIGSVAMCSMATRLLAEWGMGVAPRAAAGSLLLAAASTTMRCGGSDLSRNQDRSVNWMTDRYPDYRVILADTANA